MQVRMKRSDKRKMVQEYIRKYNPYKPSAGLGYNVRKMAEYAREKGCHISELSSEEAAMFETKQEAAE